jgi:hypothetical protein
VTAARNFPFDDFYRVGSGKVGGNYLPWSHLPAGFENPWREEQGAVTTSCEKFLKFIQKMIDMGRWPAYG